MSLAPGAHLGRYELFERLGAGAMGEVWSAMLRGPHGFARPVALKILKTGLNERHWEALIHEARIGAVFDHPNVVSAYELAQAGGRWYVAMDLVAGVPASAFSRSHRLPGVAIVGLGAQACDGLAYVHGLGSPDGRSYGLVHRDVKPPNLLVDPSGRVRIADFGIARLAGVTEDAAGTPGFMAPEQMEGEEAVTADVFALGMSLIWLATGEKPLAGRLTKVLRVHRHVRTPAIRAALEARCPGLSDVLFRATDQEPSRRYPSMAAFGIDLRALVDADDRGALASAVGWMVEVGAARLPSAPSLTPSPAPVTIVGREREKVALRDACAEPGRVVVVHGPAGSGKSHLVQHVLPADDDVVHVDLGEATGADLPGRMGVALGADGAGTVEAVRQVLSAHPVQIVVFDDADAVAEPVADLIQQLARGNPSVRWVCTCRRVLDLDDAWVLRLGGLKRDAAERLLAAAVGEALAVPDVQRLLAVTDRLPLELQLLGARVRQVGVQEALREGAVGGEDIVERVRVSWEGLSPDLQTLLGALCTYVGPFGLRDAAAVAGTLPLGGLEALVDHSLLEVRGQRFRTLRVVRAVVGRLWDPERIRAAELLHGQWHARLGEQLRLMMATTEDQRMRARCLPDLLVAHERAVARGDAPTTVACGLALTVPLNQREGPSDRLHRVLDTCEATGVRTTEVRALRWQIRAFAHKEAPQVEKQLAWDIREENDPRLRALLVRRWAEVAGLQRLPGPEVLSALEKSWVTLKLAGDPTYVQCLADLGYARQRVGDVGRGVAELRRALHSAPELSQARLWRWRLGLTEWRTGRTLDAVATIQACLEEFEAVRSWSNLSVALAAVSLAMLQAGSFEEALRTAVGACRVAERYGLVGLAPRGMTALAFARWKLGHVDEAADLVGLLRSHPHGDATRHTVIALDAALAHLRGDENEGERLLEELVALGPQGGMHPSVVASTLLEVGWGPEEVVEALVGQLEGPRTQPPQDVVAAILRTRLALRRGSDIRGDLDRIETLVKELQFASPRAPILHELDQLRAAR